MIHTYNFNEIIWHDLENPTPEEIAKIISECNIPKKVGNDLLSPTPKLRVLPFKDGVYIVMHFPDLKSRNAPEGRQEVDFIIGKKYLITAHYDGAKHIARFAKKSTDESIFEKSELEANSSFIFHKLIKHLYQHLLGDVELIRESLERAEDFVFKGEERKMVVELSKIHRDILRFKHATSPHRDAITMLYSVVREFLGEQYEFIIHDMSGEYQRVERRMQANKDLLDELRSTNNSLLEAKQNEAIKGLTMMAFITFPLTLTAAIFAMRAEGMPIVHLPHAFWIIMGLMLSIALMCLAFLSYKKWL